MAETARQAPSQALTKPGKLIKLLDQHGINHAAGKQLAKEMQPCKELVEKEHLTHERVPEAVSEPQDAPLLSCHHRHALFSAAERAYNRHLALRLRPDDVWLTIAQGVAEHINAPGNAEAFRSKFVAHEGKKELVVKQGPVPDYPAFVEDVVALAEQSMVDVTLPAALRCDFTTTTPSSAIASRIAIMKALESYFSYSLMLTCGIPAVIMEGSLEDWERVESKVRQIESLDLGLDWWFTALKPVLAKLTDTYKGQVDEAWWGSILTHHSMCSGPQYWSGWLCTFVPYGSDGKRQDVTAMLDQDEVPSGTQTVAFKLTEPDGRVRKMELLAGFLGCTVDAAEGSIAPCIGWAVAEDAAQAEARLAERKVGEAVAAISAWAAANVPGASLGAALTPPGPDNTKEDDDAQGTAADGAESWRLAQMRRLVAAVKELQRLAEERKNVAAAGGGAKAAATDGQMVLTTATAACALSTSLLEPQEREEFAALYQAFRLSIRHAQELLYGDASAPKATAARSWPRTKGLLGAVRKWWQSVHAG